MSTIEITIGPTEKSLECLESEGRQLRDQVAKWLTDYFGERCPDHYRGCPCCDAWEGFDLLFKEIQEC